MQRRHVMRPEEMLSSPCLQAAAKPFTIRCEQDEPGRHQRQRQRPVRAACLLLQCQASTRLLSSKICSRGQQGARPWLTSRWLGIPC